MRGEDITETLIQETKDKLDASKKRRLKVLRHLVKVGDDISRNEDNLDFLESDDDRK